MFTIADHPLPGTLLLAPRIFLDHRGDFVKTMHEGLYGDLGVEFKPVEEFLSTSHQGVLRGMHFQLPPHDHAKLVYCVRGRVKDVLLDLRRNSPTYGQATAMELSAANRHILYIPQGLAHGFLSLEPDTVMIYKTTTVHQPSHDAGIRYDSFGFDWETTTPIINDRDLAHPPLSAFVSPF